MTCDAGGREDGLRPLAKPLNSLVRRRVRCASAVCGSALGGDVQERRTKVRSRSLLRPLACTIVVAFLSAPVLAEARRSAARPIGTVELSSLPAEARRTVELVVRGGPFPFRRDGVVFENREGRLPPRARSYYHEYTVPTPGQPDRGPRRIIVGGGREFYYSDDHYRSFRRVEGVP